MDKRFYNVKDVSEILGVSESKGYKIIRQLNEELSRKGYITIAGKIPAVYFEERTYIRGKSHDISR